MSLRGLWFPKIAVLCVLGITPILPAFGKGGTAGFSSRPSIHVGTRHVGTPIRSSAIVPRTIDRHNGMQAYRQAYNRVRGIDSLIALWPYSSFFWPTPIDAFPVESEFSSDPYVIAIHGQPHESSVRATSANFRDYSYVTGCYAIPNGYHCDTHHGGTAP
jgi:hypothetical protein